MLLSSAMGPRLMKKLHLDTTPVGRKINTIVSKSSKPLKMLNGKFKSHRKSAKTTDGNGSKGNSAEGRTITGKASFYGNKHQGRKTASGKIYDMQLLTASHKSYPFGTLVKVTNLNNDKSVVVEITDRLPRTSKRTIDLSYRAAEELDMIRSGLANVKLEILDSQPLQAAEADSASVNAAGHL